MPKRLMSNGAGTYTRCLAWEKGTRVAGFLVGFETPPGWDGRKILFDRTGEGKPEHLFAVGETAALKKYTLTPRTYYAIECLGESETRAKSGHTFWTFQVDEYSDPKEIADEVRVQVALAAPGGAIVNHFAGPAAPGS